jgi:hypothetical protein
MIMTQDELADLFDSLQIEYEKKGKDLYIHCTECNHHNKKLSVNPDKGFQCFACGFKGSNLSQLPQLGVELLNESLPTKNASGDVLAYEYLKSRGIDDQSLVKLGGIGWQDFPKAITFTYRPLEEYGYTASAIKTKILDPDSKNKYFHKAEKGSPSFYIPDLKAFHESSEVVVVEGEIDALTLAYWKVNALAVTGIQKTDSVKVLGNFKTVYMCYDNDLDAKVAGQVKDALKKYTRELRLLYPTIEIKIIKLPSTVKDPNEALQSGYTKEDFQTWMNNAENYLEGTVARSADFYLESMWSILEDDSKSQGLPTLIEGLDVALGGGERLGEIDALIAEGKSGKSSFYAQRIYQRVASGTAIGYISRELSPDAEVIPNLASIHFGKNFWKLTQEEKREFKQKSIDAVKSWPLYFTCGYGKISLSEIAQFIRECKTKGVSYFYLDHLHYCMEDAEDNKEISKFIAGLKALVKEENIHLNLIVQPSKLPYGQKVSYKNMRGSVAIEQAIDQAFIFYRVPDMNNISCIELEACRHKLARQGKKIYMQYDPNTTRMLEVSVETIQPEIRIDVPGRSFQIES